MLGIGNVYQTVTSDAINRKQKSRQQAMGPSPATTTGVGSDPLSKVNEPTNVT